jgi:hypothetical protein
MGNMIFVNACIFGILILASSVMYDYLLRQRKADDRITRINGAILGAVVINFIYLFLFI